MRREAKRTGAREAAPSAHCFPQNECAIRINCSSPTLSSSRQRARAACSGFPKEGRASWRGNSQKTLICPFSTRKPVMIWSSSEPRTPRACACISRRPTEAEPASGEPVVLSVPAVPRIVRRQNGGRTRTTEGETTRERGRALPNPFISAPKDGLLDVHRGGRRTLKPDVRRKQRSPWGIGMPG